MRQPLIGDDVLYLEVAEDSSYAIFPAKITRVYAPERVSLFVMKEEEATNVKNVSHGAAHGCWFYRGEFGIQ